MNVAVEHDVQRIVNFYVCLCFSVVVTAITLFSEVLSHKSIIVSLGFALTLVAYLVIYSKELTNAWSDQLIGLLWAISLVFLSFFAAPNYGVIATFVVAPSFAFLCYTPTAGVAWSVFLLIAFYYGTFFSNAIPEEVVPYEMRRGLLAAYLLQVVISGIASGVRVYYKDRLANAHKRISMLEGIMHMCMDCKSIREDGDWTRVEDYVTAKEQKAISHGLCVQCYDTRIQELERRPI